MNWRNAASVTGFNVGRLKGLTKIFVKNLRLSLWAICRGCSLSEFSSLSDIRCALIYLLASYSNHIGNPVAINASGVIGRLDADAGLAPAALVAVTEQL